MTQKLCIANCLFAIDGRCRLEHRRGDLTGMCPYYEESFRYTVHKGAI